MPSAKRRLELVEPAYLSAPPWALTLGPEVADLCADAGYAPDPEQELALDILFAEDQHGLPSVFEFAAIAAPPKPEDRAVSSRRRSDGCSSRKNTILRGLRMSSILPATVSVTSQR
jgi:hypothetical protein